MCEKKTSAGFRTILSAGGGNHPGHTLLELLLAIFFLAVVVTAVYGAYRTTFTLINNSEHQVAQAESAAFVLSRLSEDLQSLVLGKAAFIDGEEQTFAGARKDHLSFLSSAQVILAKTDVRRGRTRIDYSAEVDETSGLLSLYRTEREVFPQGVFGDGRENRHLLCRGLREVRFSYHDEAGNIVTNWKSGGNRQEEGEETTSPPVMVGVELLFPGGAAQDKTQTFSTVVTLARQEVQ